MRSGTFSRQPTDLVLSVFLKPRCLKTHYYDYFYIWRKLYSNWNNPKSLSGLNLFTSFIIHFWTSLDEKIFIKNFATIFQRRTHWIGLLKLSLLFDNLTLLFCTNQIHFLYWSCKFIIAIRYWPNGFISVFIFHASDLENEYMLKVRNANSRKGVKYFQS